MRKWASWLLALAILIFGYILYGYLSKPSHPELVFLSVGQGDCAVIRTGGRVVLIDVGPRSENFDAGARVVAPKLRQMGISRVDMVILSHPDADHIGGLAGLSKKVTIGEVIFSRAFEKSAPLIQSLIDANLPSSRWRMVSKSTFFKVGEVQFFLFAPHWNRQTESDNEGSLFVKVQSKNASALFTGDASDETEYEMIRAANWKCDLLKAGHHGSSGATSDGWLEVVRPKAIVFSCGRDNSYGHPARDTLDRATRRKIRSFRTDLQGDLRFIFTEKGLAYAP